MHGSLLRKSRPDNVYLSSNEGFWWPHNPHGSKSEVNFPFPNLPSLWVSMSLQALACLRGVCVLGSEKGTYGHRSMRYLQSIDTSLDLGLLWEQSSESTGSQREVQLCT